MAALDVVVVATALPSGELFGAAMTLRPPYDPDRARVLA
jgi:hypothetical protein